MKRWFLIPLTGLLLLMFPFLFGGAGPLLRWSCSLAILLGTLPIVLDSPYLLFSLLLLLIAVLAGFSYLLGTVVFRFVTQRPMRSVLMRLVALCVLLGCWLGTVLATLSHPGRPVQLGSGADADRAQRLPALDATAAPRVLVFGASTVLGEGLVLPERERFAAQLRPSGAGSSEPYAVEVWARGGALMKDVLVMEEEALRRPAAVVILYLTFNDAINPSEASLWEALSGMNGFGMMRAFYNSAVWMTNHFERKGPLYEAKVSAFVSRARRAGARVILVGEPCADYVHYANVRHGITMFHGVLARVAREQGALYVDFPSELLDMRDDFLFVDSVHLNRHGHRILAERLNSVLAGVLAQAGA